MNKMAAPNASLCNRVRKSCVINAPMLSLHGSDIIYFWSFRCAHPALKNKEERESNELNEKIV